MRVVGVHLLLAVWTIVTAFPILWIYLTSLKTKADAFALPPRWLFTPTLSNYTKAVTAVPFFDYLKNSAMVAIAATVLSVVLGLMFSYALARFRFVGRDFLASMLLSVRVFPAVVTIVPLMMMMKTLRLLDNPVSLILTYSAHNLPLAAWLLVGFMKGIPEELEQAALIDGCSRLQAFLLITLRLLIPGIVVATIFSLLTAWNEFLFSLVFMFNNLTLPVAVSMTMTEMGIDWGQASALASLILLPVLVFTIFSSRYIVEGLTAGAVKG